MDILPVWEGKIVACALFQRSRKSCAWHGERYGTGHACMCLSIFFCGFLKNAVPPKKNLDGGEAKWWRVQSPVHYLWVATTKHAKTWIYYRDRELEEKDERAMAWNKMTIRNKEQGSYIALQCDSYVKLIAALFFIPYSSRIWGDSRWKRVVGQQWKRKEEGRKRWSEKGIKQDGQIDKRNNGRRKNWADGGTDDGGPHNPTMVWRTEKQTGRDEPTNSRTTGQRVWDKMAMSS